MPLHRTAAHRPIDSRASVRTLKRLESRAPGAVSGDVHSVFGSAFAIDTPGGVAQLSALDCSAFMCMVIFMASRSPLPLIPWQPDTPAFNVADLSEHEERVRRHFSVPHVRYAGSHTQCGCGFNEGRKNPECYDDPAKDRVAALASSTQLARYVREHHVEQIYSCWSGDEAEPQKFERQITPEALIVEDFFFREREFFNINHDKP